MSRSSGMQREMNTFASVCIVVAATSLAVACEVAPAPTPTKESAPVVSAAAAAPPTPAAPSNPVVAAGSPSAQAGLSGSEVAKLCDQLCQKTGALPCVDIPACKGGCEASYNLPLCRGPLGAMLTCTIAASAESFVCEGRSPSLIDGVCEAEQERAASCLESAMSGATAGR